MSSLHDLDALLGDLVATIATDFPQIGIPLETFFPYFAIRIPHDTAAGFLRSVHGADLYLACACAMGDPAALEIFESRILPIVRAPLAKAGFGGAARDEVEQLLREKLLLRTPERAPKVEEYGGRGPLSAWLRVVALRTAISARRSQAAKGASPLLDPLLSPDVTGPDPEVVYLRQRYHPQFCEALAEAIASLTVKERNMLRLSAVDGLSIDQIGAMYQVHRSTVARWIAKIREVVSEETRRRVTEKLRLHASELSSLMRVIAEDLDVSVRRLLQEEDSSVKGPPHEEAVGTG